MLLVESGSVIAVQQRLANGQIAYLAIIAQQRSSRSRAPRGHLRPSLHRPFPHVTHPAEAYEAAQIRSSSGNPSSPATAAITASPVAS